MARVSKAYLPTDEEFITLVENSKTMGDICRGVGYTRNAGGSDEPIRKRIAELGLSLDHHDIHANKPRTPLSEILVENSTYTNLPRLKIRMLEEGLLVHECELCKNPGVWNDLPITLQLDHINGVSNDHRRKNLRLLCPNCHSQTVTYAGGNKGFGGIVQ